MSNHHVYVATSFGNGLAANTLANELHVRSGGMVSCPRAWWLEEQDQSLVQQPGFKTEHLDTWRGSDVVAQWAIDDCDAVFSADTVVVLGHPDCRGALVEYGIAVGLKKRIILVNPNWMPSIFAYLPKHDGYSNITAEYVPAYTMPNLAAVAAVICSRLGH